jgi:hypothetical protein
MAVLFFQIEGIELNMLIPCSYPQQILLHPGSNLQQAGSNSLQEENNSRLQNQNTNIKF